MLVNVGDLPRTMSFLGNHRGCAQVPGLSKLLHGRENGATSLYSAGGYALGANFPLIRLGKQVAEKSGRLKGQGSRPVALSVYYVKDFIVDPRVRRTILQSNDGHDIVSFGKGAAHGTPRQRPRSTGRGLCRTMRYVEEHLRIHRVIREEVDLHLGVFDLDISKEALKLYAWLEWLAAFSVESYDPSPEDLAKLLNISVEQVGGLIEEVTKHRLLKIRTSNGKTVWNIGSPIRLMVHSEGRHEVIARSTGQAPRT